MDANNNDAEVFVVLCNDVLLQVLQHGNRRQLVKLQRIGRRFHKMIEVYFRDKPFLRLKFRLAPGFFFFFNSKCTKPSEICELPFNCCFTCSTFRDGLEHLILAPLAKQPSGRKLAEFPRFLRFDSVVLIYNRGRYNDPCALSLFRKKRLFLQHLQVLKPALVDTNLFRFTARICLRFTAPFCFSGPNYKDLFFKDFEDHFAVLEHLRNKLLPICNSSRHYEFEIVFSTISSSDPNAATNLIESLLKLPQIVVCSDVKIDVRDCRSVATLLPVEAIAKWLNQKSNDPTGVNGQKNGKKKEKFLEIYLFEIQNGLKMVSRLTEVYCLFCRK